MKNKLFYIFFGFLGVLLISWCGKETQQTILTWKNNINVSKQTIEDNLSGNLNEERQLVLQKEQQKQEEQKVVEHIDLKQIKTRYTQRLKNLENLWVEVISTANCTWVCDLDMKDRLSQQELKIAKQCFEKCIQMQQKAKQKLKILEEKQKQLLKKYPQKCIDDAKARAEKIEKDLKNSKVKEPFNKQEFIKFESERCLLIYWFTSWCEKIKKWKTVYEKCKSLKQLQQDLDFIKQWQNQKFEDYLKFQGY